MRKKNLFFILPIILVGLNGCAQTTEFVKVILGNTTKTLEKERVNAITRTYQCDIDDCFDAVLSLARDQKQLEPRTEKFFEVFMKNRVKSYIIVMGVAGNIETTEVGIFFPDGQPISLTWK